MTSLDVFLLFLLVVQSSKRFKCFYLFALCGAFNLLFLLGDCHFCGAVNPRWVIYCVAFRNGFSMFLHISAAVDLWILLSFVLCVCETIFFVSFRALEIFFAG